ncbi:MAG: electron transport complex subunit RsxC [Selenomonadaceae bacterium]|nr:electron transport complex subunit RsxC [Selenomonadaceae bacterium]
MFHRFFGGIHPHDGKELAKGAPIETMPAPDVVAIPLSQHIGAPCKPCVKIGERVLRGQRIATTDAFLHADIHASVSGKVKKFEDGAIVIENDGEDAWVDGLPLDRDWHAMTKEELLAAVKDAGIVGMGGATFPAFVKLAPKKPVDVLILNGAECEPYLTADDRLMREEGERVAEGARILAKILGVQRAVIAIEDNKPEAADAMRAAVAKAEATGKDSDLPKIEVAQLRTRYPQGAEKMLIYAITGREVPLGDLPMDAGAVVQNVATAAAIYDACAHGLPLTERITTVSGDAIAHPKNLRVRIGTSYQDVIDYCGGFSASPDKILAGGPMMGRAQERLDVPITKGSSGILALTRKLTEHGPELNCIRCGRCVQACPMGLIPSMLSILGQRKDVVKARDDYGVMNCVECGCCTYVCPAKRNIVQYIRATKGAVKALAAKEKAKQKAKEAATA